MNQITLRVGKKGAIYIPKKILSDLNIKEGDPVIVKIYENKLVLEIIPDPLTLAIKTKKWAKITVEDFEKDSEAMQKEMYDA